MNYRYLHIDKLQQGYPCLFQKPSATPVVDYTTVFGINCIEYISSEEDYLPERLILKNGSVVIPTEFELYLIDGENYKLKEDYYFKRDLQGNAIDILQKPTHNYIHPIWDDELEVWLESATDIELVHKDRSDISGLLITKERELFFSIRKATLKGEDTTSLEAQKAGIAFDKEELQKMNQASGDYLRGTLSEVDYIAIKDYVNLLIQDLPCVRPPIMSTYDIVV